MSKRQLIDDIRLLNPSADATFLAQFNEDSLKQYLDRLQGARDHQVLIHISTHKPITRAAS